MIGCVKFRPIVPLSHALGRQLLLEDFISEPGLILKLDSVSCYSTPRLKQALALLTVTYTIVLKVTAHLYFHLLQLLHRKKYSTAL